MDNELLSVHLSFCGCNCGCTPGEGVTIKAKTQEDLDKAAASWAVDFRLSGSHPFAKITGLTEAAITHATKIISLIHEDEELISQNEISQARIDRIEMAAQELGIKVPAEKQLECQSMKDKIAVNEAKSLELQQERDHLRYDYEAQIIYDDDEEEAQC